MRIEADKRKRALIRKGMEACTRILELKKDLKEAKEIEPLAGEVCPQFIRCGKSGCRCQNGHPHGPYHYRIWREGTKVRKVYVKATEVEEVKAACVLHRAMTRSLQDVRQTKLHLTQSMQKEWRRTQRLMDAPAA